MSEATGSPARKLLERNLGLADAIVIGVGSMVGAGVYAVWAPASRSGGQLMLIGLFIAALVAFSNALSSARLAVLYPESGGTYVYGRERLGPTWGFIAGWSFVAGKTASCAAMAATIGVYVLPDHSKIVAITSVLAITAVNIGGLQRTVFVTKILLLTSASILALVIASGWTNRSADLGSAWPWSDSDEVRPVPRQIYDVMQSAGLLFFAFAGYARIATLSEEVRNPSRTIPRAITISLSSVLVVYTTVAITLTASFTPAELSQSLDPLRHIVENGPANAFSPLVRVGAAIAALGALLNLIPGVSRTALAMSRRRDLPKAFAHIDPRRSLPIRAELTVALLAIVIITVFDLRSSIALSGVGVLVYYAITNASALTLPSRRRDMVQASLGLIGCLALVACLPQNVLIVGSCVLVCGVLVHRIGVWNLERRFSDAPG